MTLENKAKEVLIVVQNYCESFSIEPSVALRKTYSSLLAACQLKLLSQRETRSNQETYIDEQPQYSKTGVDYNARGDPTRVKEMAVIPFRGLMENDKAITDLQNVINRFK